MPSFIKWEVTTGFTFKGSNYHEGWNTYLFRVTATEKTDTAIKDSSFLLEVESSIDCINHVELNVPDSFAKEISYGIKSFT
jgi:hypothetical protein